MTEQYDLSTIDQTTLAPIVQQALNVEVIDLTEWRYQRVHGGAGDVGTVISAIYRFSGQAYVHEKLFDWSIILKVVGTTATQDDPSASRYWKREVLAYQSGQLADLPGGLATPRYFGTIEFSPTVIGLWLEDLVDAVGAKWLLEQYGMVARHLGQFNGAFLAQTNLPSWPWLHRDRFQELARGVPAGAKFDQLRQSLDRPQTQRWFLAEDDMHGMLQLWDERVRYIDALNRLPQTLVHGDAFRRNLFARRATDGIMQTVAIDWTFVGIGPIGMELASLVQGSLFFSEVDVAEAYDLDQVVFDGYIAGLADAGWHGDPRQARLGYTASSAMIFGLGYGAFKLNESNYPWLEQAFGLPIDEFMALGAALNRFFLTLADEARTLFDFVRIGQD